MHELLLCKQCTQGYTSVIRWQMSNWHINIKINLPCNIVPMKKTTMSSSIWEVVIRSRNWVHKEVSNALYQINSVQGKMHYILRSTGVIGESSEGRQKKYLHNPRKLDLLPTKGVCLGQWICRDLGTIREAMCAEFNNKRKPITLEWWNNHD